MGISIIKQIFPFVIFTLGMMIILIIYYLYAFYFVSLANNPYHFKNPGRQIIKDQQVIDYYEKLEQYNSYGVSLPVGLKGCKALFLLNIATTNIADNRDIYTGNPRACTLEVIQESLGGKNESFQLIENGDLSMLDVFPIRISNNKHITDLPSSLIDTCVQFTANTLFDIVGPNYVFSFGEGGKHVLNYMKQHTYLFAVEPFDNQYNLEMYKIVSFAKNNSYIFIKSIHPSSIYYDITVEQGQYLDDVFKFLRENVLQMQSFKGKIFSYKKFIEDKKMDEHDNISRSSILRCVGKDNYI